MHRRLSFAGHKAGIKSASPLNPAGQRTSNNSSAKNLGGKDVEKGNRREQQQAHQKLAVLAHSGQSEEAKLTQPLKTAVHMRGPAGAQSADVIAVDKLDRYGVCVSVCVCVCICVCVCVCMCVHT